MTFQINGTTGLTFPDSTTQATRAVNRSGDTMTGALNITTSLGSNQLTVQGVEADIWLNSTGANGSWRILGSTGANTHRFRIYDQSNNRDALNIDSSGRVTIPTQTAAIVAFTSAYNDYTWTSDSIIVPDAVDAANNVGSAYSSSNGRFTAPVAGWYMTTCNMMIKTPSANSNRMVLKKNGTDHRAAGGASDCIQPANQVQGIGNNQSFVTGTVIVKLAAGDYLQWAARSGSSLGPVYGGHSWMQFHLMF